MPSESKANDISIRFQSARVDGTWRELRTKLDMESRPEVLTFKELGNIYLEDYVKSYNRAYKSKKSRIAILGQKLAQVQVSSLTPHHVTEFVSSRKRHGACNRTINRDLIVLGHMLRWAVQDRYIQSNPLPEIQKLREIKWEGQRPSEEVVEAVFGKLDARVVPLYTFLRETGCRREEVLSLTHEQLDLGRGEVVLRDNTKNGKDRRVPLTKRALWAINAMPKASKYVFYHPDSLTRWDSCRKPWIKAREAAGHPWLRAHDLRHAFGIRLAEQGCPMHFISEVMGHHSVDFTRRVYAKFSPESASRAVLRALEGDQNGTNLAHVA